MMESPCPPPPPPPPRGQTGIVHQDETTTAPAAAAAAGTTSPTSVGSRLAAWLGHVANVASGPPAPAAPSKTAPECHPPIVESLPAAALLEIERAALQKSRDESARAARARARDEKMALCHREWMEKVLPAWDKYKTSKTVKRLCMDGIPSAVRGKAWPLLMGNTLQITPALMEIFYQHAQAFKQDVSDREKRQRRRKRRRARREQRRAERQAGRGAGGDVSRSSSSSSASDGEGEAHAGDGDGNSSGGGDGGSGGGDEGSAKRLGKSKSLHLIDCDLPRTFPHLAFFAKGQPMEHDLRRMLEAYSFYRPDIGYIQGMSYIAAVLLLNVEPYVAFQCFANLLQHNIYFDFFRLERDRIDVHLGVYASLLDERLPKLARHFKQEGVRPDMYMIDWLMTLFSRSMPMNVSARVWDLYLSPGGDESSLFRVAIGLLRMHEAQLLGMDMGGILSFLHNIPPDLDEDELFRHVAKVHISRSRFAAIQSQQRKQGERLAKEAEAADKDKETRRAHAATT